jgi:hypothetical protein
VTASTDWAKIAEDFKATNGSHSSFFTWEGGRSVEEEGVLIDFARALQEQNKIFFAKASHRGKGNDPPDCEALGFAGERIGIELTELIDPSAAAASHSDEPFSPKLWSEDDIAVGLENRILAKDRASPKGGPYHEYVLLIYTDEPGLSVEAARRVIATKTFSATRLINTAYLLMTYDPLTKTHPCLKMQLG